MSSKTKKQSKSVRDGRQKKSKSASAAKNAQPDMAKGLSAGMQPHNILAAAIEGQHSFTRLFGPMMSTEMPNLGAPVVVKASKKKDVKKIRSAKESKSSKKCRRYDSGCESSSDSFCGSDSESWCSDSSSSSSSECYDPCCPNPIVDVTSLMEDPAKDATVIPFGFVPTRLDITTPEEMPFVLAFACDNTQVIVTPNTASGFTLADVQTALGLSEATFCAAGQPLILANLPPEMAQFEGLYVLAFLPSLELGGYCLRRINWRDDDCGSMEVGEWVEIKLGSTFGVYEITSIEESTQRITLEFLDILYIQCARLTHMTVPGQSYCYFDEIPLKEETCSSSSESDCSDSSSESCSDSW